MHPLLVNRVFFPLHERLLGKRTLAWFSELQQTQWMDPSRLEEYRFRRLRRLLDHAYTYVPYYRRIFDEHDVPPHRIQSFDDLRRVPYLTRDDLRTHFTELMPTQHVPRSRPWSTGGSTGRPVTLMIDMDRMAFSDAARLRAHGWFGLDLSAREIALWGSVRDLSGRGVLRAVRDRILNHRVLSAFDMSKRNLASYALLVDRFRPEKMYGYATAITLFSQYLMREARSRPPASLRAVFTTAEPLFDYQRALIREGFGCPVAQEYGSRDAGMIASECPSGGLHVNAEGVHVELLGPRGSSGELVITNFDTPAMPIIRYRTQDMAASSESACACGRALPLLGHVEGRQTDFVVTPDGRVLHALAVIYILRDIPSIHEFRVTQEDIRRVVVEIVASDAFGSEQERVVIRGLSGLLGPGVDIDVVKTERIVRPESGKYRYVVSKVAERHLSEILAGAAE